MKKTLLTMIFAGLLIFSLTREAGAGLFDTGIPVGWTSIGSSGALGANGVVTLAPSGGTQYGWVSTNGGVSGAGLSAIGGTNGSRLTSSAFSATSGDALEFYFNFVTSDGAGFADYAWSRLLDSATSNQVALLFTARTTPSGSSVPGFGMPAIAATIDPATVTIVPGGPSWSPLGGSSGACYNTGCGYSDWVKSTYSVASTGNYMLEFGVANWLDTAYQTGLAFDGITIGGVPIEETNPTIPEPASMFLLGSGLLGFAGIRRKRK